MSLSWLVAKSPEALYRGDYWECVIAHGAEQAADMSGEIPADGQHLTVQCPDGSVVQVEMETEAEILL